MKNRITVTIGNQNYTLVATEDGEYIQQLSAQVNTEINQVIAEGHLAYSDAIVLASMNLADKYCKERDAADNLRTQLKEYLDESSRLKTELSDAKREIFRLQKETPKKK